MPIDYTRPSWDSPPDGSRGIDYTRRPEAPVWPEPPAASPAQANPPSRPRPRWWLRAVVAVALLAAAGGATAYLLGRKGVDGASVALPAAAQGSERTQLHDYLTGPGAPVRALARTVPTDLKATESDRCTGLTAALTKLGQPARLSRLAVAVPDPSVRDAALATLAATARYLPGCAAGRPDPTSRAQVTFHVKVLRRLLFRNGAPA